MQELVTLRNRASCIRQQSHMDTPDRCHIDSNWWYSYPVQDFDYKYNSFGFRGNDYTQYQGCPVNICLGDSFTENLGGPVEYSWPGQLAQNFNIPTLNLGVNGAGNDAISVINAWAQEYFNVQSTFVMYSFLHRRLKDGEFTQDVFNIDTNIEYFIKYRISNAHECTLAANLLQEDEYSFMKSENIFCIKDYNPNRDGHHMNQEANKIYADYLYNQWKIKNES